MRRDAADPLRVHAGETFPSWWPNAVGNFLGSSVHDLRLRRVSNTVVEVPASVGGGMAAIAIGGRWRYRESPVQTTVSGPPGLKRAFVTATARSYYEGQSSGIHVLTNRRLAQNGIGQSDVPHATFWFDPSEFAVPGLALKLRLRAVVLTDDVAPGAFTFAMRNVQLSSDSGGFHAVTLNAAHVPGSDFTINAPVNAAFTNHRDFDPPAGSIFGHNVFVSTGQGVTCRGHVWTALYYFHVPL